MQLLAGGVEQSPESIKGSASELCRVNGSWQHQLRPIAEDIGLDRVSDGLIVVALAGMLWSFHGSQGRKTGINNFTKHRKSQVEVGDHGVQLRKV